MLEERLEEALLMYVHVRMYIGWGNAGMQLNSYGAMWSKGCIHSEVDGRNNDK